jgi:hypothetical protein
VKVVIPAAEHGIVVTILRTLTLLVKSAELVSSCGAKL